MWRHQGGGGWGRWRRRSGAVVSLGNIFIRAGHVNTTGRAGYVTSHPVRALTADCHLDMRPGNYVKCHVDVFMSSLSDVGGGWWSDICWLQILSCELWAPLILRLANTNNTTGGQGAGGTPGLPSQPPNDPCWCLDLLHSVGPNTACPIK